MPRDVNTTWHNQIKKWNSVSIVMVVIINCYDVLAFRKKNWRLFATRIRDKLHETQVAKSQRNTQNN